MLIGGMKIKTVRYLLATLLSNLIFHVFSFVPTHLCHASKETPFKKNVSFSQTVHYRPLPVIMNSGYKEFDASFSAADPSCDFEEPTHEASQASRFISVESDDQEVENEVRLRYESLVKSVAQCNRIRQRLEQLIADSEIMRKELYPFGTVYYEKSQKESNSVLLTDLEMNLEEQLYFTNVIDKCTANEAVIKAYQEAHNGYNFTSPANRIM
jgi:hypothetical protein